MTAPNEEFNDEERQKQPQRQQTTTSNTLNSKMVIETPIGHHVQNMMYRENTINRFHEERKKMSHL